MKRAVCLQFRRDDPLYLMTDLGIQISHIDPQNGTHRDEPGRDGLFNLIKSIPPTLKYEPGTIVAEKDFVIVHGRFSGFVSATSPVIPAFSVAYYRVSAVASVSAMPSRPSYGHRKCPKKVPRLGNLWVTGVLSATVR